MSLFRHLRIMRWLHRRATPSLKTRELMLLLYFANVLCIHRVNSRRIEYVDAVLKLYRPTVELPTATLLVAQDSNFIKVGSYCE